MNPHDDITKPVPENDFLGAARAVDTGQHIPQPRTSLDPMFEDGDHSMTSLGNSVRNVISDYPGPAVLIGAGLAWMLLSREQKYSRPLPSRIKDKALRGKEQIADAVHHAKDQVHDAQQSLLDRARGAKEEAMHGYEAGKMKAGLRAETSKVMAQEKLHDARDAYYHMIEDSPLILGACAMVAGLAIGLLIPSTQREDEIMGSQRDGLLDQARGIVENARQAAVATLRSGSENVKAHLAEATESAKETLSETLENVKQAASTEPAADQMPTEDSIIASNDPMI